MVNSNARLIGNHITDNTSESPGGGIYMLDSNPELFGNIMAPLIDYLVIYANIRRRRRRSV